jgi:hypothetical protein
MARPSTSRALTELEQTEILNEVLDDENVRNVRNEPHEGCPEMCVGKWRLISRFTINIL